MIQVFSDSCATYFAIPSAPIDRNHPFVNPAAVRSTDSNHSITNATEAVVPPIAFT